MAVCELISVGTEILLGDILNSDAKFIAEELAKLGISMFYQNTVGDNRERLYKLLDTAVKRSDIVILSGGLGPTPDDITKEVACEYFGKEMYLHEPSYEKIKAYFAGKNMYCPENNKKQAMLPRDCVIFENNNGTAPGLGMEKDGKHILLLPGPPRELKPMFRNSAVPYLRQFSDKVIISHSVRTFGIGESDMAERVSDLLESTNPTVAPYAKDGEALLRVTAMAESEDEAEKICEPVIAEIRKRLGGLVYGVDCANIEEAVVALLKEKGMKAATAESCTGGLAAKRITNISGASAVFDCGIISYSNEIKHKLLGVSEADLEKYGAVSEQVAEQMAIGALKISGADVAVSVTGIAGPTGDGTDKPVGLSYIAVADRISVWCMQLKTGRKDRDYNRIVNSSNALNMIRLYINKDLKGGRMHG